MSKEECKGCGFLFACEKCSEQFVEIDRELWESREDEN